MARKTRLVNTRTAVAVIGEGITEHCYFSQMKKYETLPVNLKPDLPQHSNYQHIFKKAKELLRKEFDLVFCVIDLDVILSDQQKLRKYKESKTKLPKKVHVCECMPCFDLWFLMHYEYSTKIYQTYSSLEPHLKRYIHDYAKSKVYFENKKIYAFLKDRQNNATQNCSQLAKAYERCVHSKDFPKCEVHTLIAFLLAI